jgi:hypothetical protein
MRPLYQSLLWMHPPRFRERFGEEMLWIFDETLAASGKAFLFVDCLESVARQWVVRSGVWKVALAVLIALIQAAFLLHPYDEAVMRAPCSLTQTK